MREVPVQKPGKADDAVEENVGRYHCALRERPPRVFDSGVSSERQRLILTLGNKWTAGTTLRYYFFDKETDRQKVLFLDGTTEWRSWVGDDEQKAVVRQGFQAWTDVGIGINFLEVDNREEAEIRIGFMQGDGAWSWLGREILEHGKNERTMNFG